MGQCAISSFQCQISNIGNASTERSHTAADIVTIGIAFLLLFIAEFICHTRFNYRMLAHTEIDTNWNRKFWLMSMHWK